MKNKHEVLIHNSSRWKGTGHNGEIVKDKKGRTWMPYHAYDAENAKKGRLVLLDQIKWDSDGWPYVDNAEPAAGNPLPVF